MAEQSIQSVIQAYLEETLLIEFDDEITDETDLFKAGILDSFGYLQLVNFLKDSYDIEFTIDEMMTNIAVSLEGLVELVEQKVSN